MKRSTLMNITSFLVLSLALTACGSDDKSSDNKANTEIKMTFAAQINDTPLACGTNTETVGKASTAPDIKYFGAYISEIAVATDKGDFQPVTLKKKSSVDHEKGIALLAFCGSSLRNNTIEGTVAKADDYTRVRFTLGVPAKYNHLDATKSTGVLNKEINMHWSWTSGYKHVRMDAAGWNIHLGSTVCTGKNEQAKCSNGNRPTYEFRNLDLNKDTFVFDYADLVGQSDITKNTEKTAPGCMSSAKDPECQAVFKALGMNLTTGRCDNNDCSAQNWIRTVRK